MSAYNILRSTSRIIGSKGETMVLSRTGVVSTITLKGKRYGGETVEGGGSAVQQVFKVKIRPDEILASSWASKVPVRNDKLLVGGRTRIVLDARPLNHEDTLMLYELEVAG